MIKEEKQEQHPLLDEIIRYATRTFPDILTQRAQHTIHIERNHFFFSNREDRMRFSGQDFQSRSPPFRIFESVQGYLFEQYVPRQTIAKTLPLFDAKRVARYHKHRSVDCFGLLYVISMPETRDEEVDMKTVADLVRTSEKNIQTLCDAKVLRERKDTKQIDLHSFMQMYATIFRAIETYFQEHSFEEHMKRRREDDAVSKADVTKTGFSTFGIFYKTYYGPLFTYALFLTEDESYAENIVQTSFLTAMTHLKDFDGKNVSGWIYKIVRNTAFSERQRRKFISFSERYHSGDKILSPEILLLQREEEKRRKVYLTALPEPYRHTFLLRLEGLKHEEIADTLHVKRGTVTARLIHAKKMLQEKMEEGLYRF